MNNDFIEVNSRPDYDLILNGLNFSDANLFSLGKCQFTEDLLNITDKLESQGYDQAFINNVIAEAVMRYASFCRNQEENW